MVRKGYHIPLRLIGNQVRDLNRPATVSSTKLFGHVHCVTDLKTVGKTVRKGNKSGDLPCD